MYKPWISWLCEHVHGILADLHGVPCMNCTSYGFFDCVNMYAVSWPIFLVYRTWIVQVLDSLIVRTCTVGKKLIFPPLSRYPIYTLYANWEFWTDSQTLYRDTDNKRKHWHFYINLSISSFLSRGIFRLKARTCKKYWIQSIGV